MFNSVWNSLLHIGAITFTTVDSHFVVECQTLVHKILMSIWKFNLMLRKFVTSCVVGKSCVFGNNNKVLIICILFFNV
jgi:hypothetical protein